MIFTTDTYIPLDAVVKRSGANFYINLPQMVVGAMPWSEPLARSETKTKTGPRAETIEKLYGSYSPSVLEKSAGGDK